MPSLSVSANVAPVPFSMASLIPSPSLSVSYGFVLPVASVFGGDKPPEADAGIPLIFTAPSALPSLSESVPPASITSLIPSPSLSVSRRFGIPSPSVSQSTAEGVHAAASNVSKMPSLSSSESSTSARPSPSLSGGQPLVLPKPATNGQTSTASNTPSPSESKSLKFGVPSPSVSTLPSD